MEIQLLKSPREKGLTFSECLLWHKLFAYAILCNPQKQNQKRTQPMKEILLSPFGQRGN